MMKCCGIRITIFRIQDNFFHTIYVKIRIKSIKWWYLMVDGDIMAIGKSLLHYHLLNNISVQ
jgi:hypothetical protein